MSDKKYTNEETDDKWFSQRLGSELEKRLHNNSISIEKIIYETIQKLNSEYRSNILCSDIDNLAIPSASLSIFRLNNRKVDFYQIGDSTSIIKLKTIKLTYCMINQFQDLIIRSLNISVKKSNEMGISYVDALKYGKELLKDNRNKRNTPGGY